MPQTKDWEKIEELLTPIMENKVKSIIGEDGLTVWDFAELRDSVIDLVLSLLHSELNRQLDEILYLINHHKIDSFEKGELLGEIVKSIQSLQKEKV